MGKLSEKARTLMRRHYCSAVILAAGDSARMGEDKLFLDLLGVPVLARTLLSFEQCDYISEILVVTKPEKIEAVARLCEEHGIGKATKILSGGQVRSESSLAGVSEINPRADIVLIHDGARPLVSAELIEELIHAAALHKAAAPALPVSDTLKTAHKGVVTGTPDRSSTFAVQSPQAFMPELIKGALTYALTHELAVTDDCSAAEALSIPVHLIGGEAENVKITTATDLILAESILKKRGREVGAPRVGQGYDVHRLVSGRPLILGGVKIDFEGRGLLGHSDADVLTHAVMDALLGAAGLGDIGRLFPDTDPEYAGISSLTLLDRVKERLDLLGLRVGNIDCTLVAQRPKIAPYREEMARNLASRLGCDPERVNVKATTQEGLGFAGREEGLATYAVALLLDR